MAFGLRCMKCMYPEAAHELPPDHEDDPPCYEYQSPAPGKEAELKKEGKPWPNVDLGGSKYDKAI